MATDSPSPTAMINRMVVLGAGGLLQVMALVAAVARAVAVGRWLI